MKKRENSPRSVSDSFHNRVLVLGGEYWSVLCRSGFNSDISVLEIKPSKVAI